MNKKLIGNLILFALLVTLGLSFIDFNRKNLSFEGHISEFIRENLDPDTRYTPLDFELINQHFLMSKQAIKKPLLKVADSIRQQITILDEHYVSLDFQNVLQKAKGHLEQLNLENVSQYLSIDAEIKRTLRAAGGLDTTAKSALYEQEVIMLDAINELNASLGNYNLSIFSLDFSGVNSLQFLHTYTLTDARGTTKVQTMFELDRESKEIISFKDVELAG